MGSTQTAATRFRLSSTGTPSLSPAFDASWEQTGSVTRLIMLAGQKDGSALTNFTGTVPITTTQDILVAQFVSAPFSYRTRILGTCSMVIRDSESAGTANAHLAYSLRSYRPSTSAFQALASNFATQTEDGTTASTRIWSAQALTATTVEPGDVLVFEVGIHAAAPTAATSAVRRFGMPAGVADFALTSGLTTDLCPWLEIQSEVLQSVGLENFQSMKVPDGYGTSAVWRPS